jgi:1-acyl-sn-glycerol-3-phosphate acyltransferase
LLRIAGRLIVMAGWLAVALLGFHLWKLARARNPWPRRFLGGIAQIAGVRVRTQGRPAPGRLLMLANHVSWIDVAALAGATGTAFVAHDGLASVPLLKWLCEMNDTIFIARHDRASIGTQIAALRAALVDRGTLTVFPEGTTSDGTALLPFKSALLGAIDPLAQGVTVQPVWLDYGALTTAIAWVGDEPGVANFKRILARRGPLELTIHFLEPLAAAALANRKSMAMAAHQAISKTMTADDFCPMGRG